MTLPTPNLDDRRFQDIVDQAKTLIPQFCPEWTDHNVSDPGVALIELFAWMTDMLLYRVNQVPDKMYVKLLELIGIRLDPPRAAQAPITFYLSAPQPTDVTVAEGTEVATVQTETNPAIIFTTDADLVVRPPTVTAALTRAVVDGAPLWTTHDLRILDLPRQQISMFAQHPAPGAAFYIGLERDHSHHVLALVMGCEVAGGAGVDPQNPPWEWQAWQGGATGWSACELEYDGTGGFNGPGEIVLHTPAMTPGEFEGKDAYWIRCRLSAAQAGPGGYQVSPDLERLRVEARGGTVTARHASTVNNEVLGLSSGMPGQVFHLLHTPVLARDATRDHLEIETPGGDPEVWKEVADFGDSGPEDRHYTLDGPTGELTLGPALLQPDGSVYRFGAIPARGSKIRFKRYQYGGGVAGNVPRHVLAVMKSAIPYVARVTNRAPALGGLDAQTLEDAKLRAPHALRTRTRAVTIDDYEYLTCQVSGISRACCITPGAQPGAPDDPPPGHVVVVALPEQRERSQRTSPEHLVLSAETLGAVYEALNARRLLGTALEVRQPRYIWLSVRAQLRVRQSGNALLRETAQKAAESALYRYLNPYTGGPDGSGWAFGRSLHVSEIFALLQRIPGVEYVEDVQVGIDDPSTPAPAEPAPSTLTLARDALICSWSHEVTVQ